jgi:LPS export ABC transporter protein LptC
MIFQHKKMKALAVVAVGLVVLAIVGFFILRGEKTSDNKQIKILSDNTDLQVRDVFYTDVGDSGIKWEIKSDLAKYKRNENLAVFEKVIMKVIMQDGKTYVMTGNQGRMNTETKDMEISGDVNIVSDKGDRLVTDILKYSDSEKRFYTESPVKLENSRMQVRGTGMSLSLTGKDVSLLSRVKARVN